MIDRHDMSVPPKYRYFRWSAKKVETVKQPKIIQVETKAWRIKVGFKMMAMSRRGPIERPEQTENPRRYPSLVFLFLTVSGVDQRTRANPRSPREERRPPEIMLE